MARRHLAAVATLAVAGAALTGCAGGGGADDASNTIDGEIKGDITVMTWRTDLVADGTYDRYVEEFTAKYPDVNVKIEAVTDYATEMQTRMSTTNYGDVLGIPTLSSDQFGQFLEPIGQTADFADTYRFLSASSFEGTQYGLAWGGNANGVVYNKKVWADAGVTELPTSEEEWLDALQLIKDNTDSIPLYTNYKGGWPLSQSFGNLGSVTNDPDAQITMAESSAPWTEGTDVYAIDSLLYESVAAGLTEPDPLTTDWEQSKVDLGTGKIASMTLGSWAISQMQAAAEDNGASADDIGFMAFPANIGGTQYGVIGGDYQLGISKHSKAKAAAWAFIQWIVGESDYTSVQGMVPTLLAGELPQNLQDFEAAGVELMELNPAPAGKESLLNDTANAAQVDINGAVYRQKLVDIARGAADGDKESYFAELNKAWGDAVAAQG